MPITIPNKFKPLFEPYRFKVYYGGRGSAKSESFARALLVKGMQKKHIILCTRELQVSIQDSVHRLLAETIHKEGLDGQYDILQSTIRHKTNGTEFLFKGLKHNIAEIKGVQGVDICWAEEAENISDRSWEYLIPTIRKEGSEIWVSYNPRNVTDPTHQRFVVNTRPDAYVCKVSWRDNPFFPDVLKREMEHLRSVDQDAYEHVWEGNFDNRKNGYIYAKLIDRARQDGRITRVPFDTSTEVFTAWDLGWGDATAIWWFQMVGREPRIIDYYENSGEGLAHYANIVKGKTYNYARTAHYLPHDAAAGNIRGDSVTVQLRNLGLQNTVLPISSIDGGIESVRQLLPMCVFDAEKCKDGLWALENYGYEYDEDRKIFKKTPRHDFSSHGADAFRYLSHAITKIKGSVTATKKIPVINTRRESFMGY